MSYRQAKTEHDKIKLMTKGAFTRVPQVDQRVCINQSEPCKQFLSTEVINGVNKLAMANFRSTPLIHFG